MNKGQVVQLGSPLDIYKWPRTLWAAKFIGTHPVNALPVKCEGGRLIVPGAQPLDLGPVERLPGSVLLSGTGTLAVPPESISIHEDHGDISAPSASVVIGKCSAPSSSTTSSFRAARPCARSNRRLGVRARGDRSAVDRLESGATFWRSG